jgi:hypothetical protein
MWHLSVPIFLTSMFDQEVFVKNFYARFHENQTNALVADIMLHTDGGTL